MKAAIATLALLAALVSPALAPADLTQATAEIKASKNVVDAKQTGPHSYWISRRGDGTRHDGFAAYACLEMPDAAKMASGQLVEIGRSECRK